MALFPRIDQPCPLGIDEQARIDGYCGRCDKAVHALDAMTDAQRRALLRAARGPICVSYRTSSRVPFGVGFGAAVALSIASPSFATETSIVADSSARSLQSRETPQQTSIGAGLNASGANWHDGETAGAFIESAPDQTSYETITVGGVRDPAAAEWVDDSSLPDLPMIRENVVPDDGVR